MTTRLLVGSAALGYTDLPLATWKRWTHGQHGPADASFKVPCRPFETLDPRLCRDSRLFVIRGARCVWSGYLLPVSTAQSDGQSLTIEAAGTFERGKHDESYVRTFTDADEGKWFLRKGSSQRFTIENSGTLIIKAEGGWASYPTNWKSGRKAELVYFLDDGHGDPLEYITQLDFLWNIDLAASWRCYIDEYTDPYDGVKISRLWERTAVTSAGESVALACSSGCRALMFGLVATANNQLETDSFAELMDMQVTASSGRVRVDEALALVADELTAGVVTSTPAGEDLEHLVWMLGDGSRSYSQEQIATLHDTPLDWRYVPPASAPGEDSFIAREMPAAPENRQRWWVVSAEDPGVTVDLTYQDLESMDIAGVLYGVKNGNLLELPNPSAQTLDWPSDYWTITGDEPVSVADDYSGYTFAARSFMMETSGAGSSEFRSVDIAVEPGKDYQASYVAQRVSTAWSLCEVAMHVIWKNAAGATITSSVVGHETAAAFAARGDSLMLNEDGLVTAPALAVAAQVMLYFYNGGVTCKVAIRSIHFDTKLPGGTVATVYSPAAPTSVEQRVRMFDYSSDRLTTLGARRILAHIVAWYGVGDSEREREPVGTIGATGMLRTIDGAEGSYAEVQTGDWVTVEDDVDHVSWPQFVVGCEVNDEDEAVSIQLGGDGGDFNYIGRAEDPARQKRKRRKGHHRRVLWHTWAMRNARAAFRKQHQYKTFQAYMKTNPLPKKHPKWGPG